MMFTRLFLCALSILLWLSLISAGQQKIVQDDLATLKDEVDTPNKDTLEEPEHVGDAIFQNNLATLEAERRPLLSPISLSRDNSLTSSVQVEPYLDILHIDERTVKLSVNLSVIYYFS